MLGSSFPPGPLNNVFLDARIEKLAIYETKDVLYRFSGGWLFNRQVNETWIKNLNSELTMLRITGAVRDIIEGEVGGFDCQETTKTSIGPLICTIPILLFVAIPLFSSIVSLVLHV